VSSRLVEYETWVRLHALDAAESHGDAARALIGRIALLELSPIVLARVLEPFPVRVRTLDALHIASAEYLRTSRVEIVVATYDPRMAEASAAVGFDLHPLN